MLTLSGPGGGGGLRGLDDQTHSCQPETCCSIMPKLCDFFYFLSLRHVLTKFLQNWSIKGIAAAIVPSRRPQNLQNEKIFLYLEIAEIDMGGQFWVEKNDSGHKNSFFLKLNPFSRGK